MNIIIPLVSRSSYYIHSAPDQGRGDTLGSFVSLLLCIYLKHMHDAQRPISIGLRDIYNWLKDERIVENKNKKQIRLQKASGPGLCYVVSFRYYHYVSINIAYI